MNKAEIKRYQKTWINLCLECVKKTPSPGDWRRWFDYSIENIAANDDSIPVFGMVNEKLKRGFEVHHHELVDQHPILDAYAKTSLGPENIRYISIIASYSASNMDVAGKLLSHWLSCNPSIGEMTHVIDQALQTPAVVKELRKDIVWRQAQFRSDGKPNQK